MNLFRKINRLLAVLLCVVLAAGCSDDDVVSDSSTSGFLKLRLTSLRGVTRAGKLDNMSDAKKIEVSMLFNDMYVTQTLNLSSVADAADLGLESEKLELRVGEYRIMGYTLFGEVKPGQEKPEKLSTIYPDEITLFQITKGHLTELDVKVNATVRGNVYFDLLKDFSNYTEEIDKANNSGKTRASLEGDPKAFAYENVEEVDLYYRKKGTSEYATPHTFKVYQKKGEKYLHTDTVNWEVGEYEITRYMLYDNRRITMLLAGDLKDTYVKVATGAYTESSFDIKFPENMNALKDYIALYNIWINSDGPNWSYEGESFPSGANWRFANRPIDEWGNQPGVQIDQNGRVKVLELGSFNPTGELHESLGDLTELVALWVGTHKDFASVERGPEEDASGEGLSYSLDKYELMRQGVNVSAHRMEIEKERLSILHPAAAGNNKLYTSKKNAPLKYAVAKPYDFNPGSISNRITKLPESIGNLQKLEYLYVANNLVTELPMSLADIKTLTDVEFYNLPFKKFPEVLERMTSVISMNFSNNLKMTPDELLRGLNAFIDSNKDELQILYVNNCGLTEFPASLVNAVKIGLIDLSVNKLTELPGTQRKIAPVQAFFDSNRITKIADDFCDTDDIEKFGASNNMLTVFPNLFKDGKDSKYRASEVDFSNNHIGKFADNFNGINVEILTLTKNDFGKVNKDKGKGVFPRGLKESRISYLLLDNCQLDSLPYYSFEGLDFLEAFELSGNNLRYLPNDFNSRNLVYITGLNLSYNCFNHIPDQAMVLPMLNKFYMSSQWDVDKNGKEFRPLKEWITNPNGYPAIASLRLIDVSGNDLRKITEERFPSLLVEFDVSGNNNIDMTIPTEVCQKIAAGRFRLGFDSDQYILGCPILDLDINK